MVQNRAWRICSVTERVTDMCWNMLALAMCEAVSMTPLDHMVDEQPSKVIPVSLFVGERGDAYGRRCYSTKERLD